VRCRRPFFDPLCGFLFRLFLQTGKRHVPCFQAPAESFFDFFLKWDYFARILWYNTGVLPTGNIMNDESCSLTKKYKKYAHYSDRDCQEVKRQKSPESLGDRSIVLIVVFIALVVVGIDAALIVGNYPLTPLAKYAWRASRGAKPLRLFHGARRTLSLRVIPNWI
jgi:hypothetical protein